MKATSKETARKIETAPSRGSPIKEMCESCGKAQAVAKGLCRRCYDKAREIPRVAISKSIEAQVLKFKNHMGWDWSPTINYLIACGIRFLELRTEIANKWDLKDTAVEM